MLIHGDNIVIDFMTMLIIQLSNHRAPIRDVQDKTERNNVTGEKHFTLIHKHVV